MCYIFELCVTRSMLGQSTSLWPVTLLEQHDGRLDSSAAKLGRL